LKERIVITGIGVFSPLGTNLDENRHALAHGICGIDKPEFVDSKYAGTLPFGEIKYSTEQLRELLNVHDENITRTSLIAIHAFREAIHNAGLSSEKIKAADTALIGASTVGGMCLTDELYRDANRVSDGSPFLSDYDCGASTLVLQKMYGCRGVVNTINTACSSSANAIMYGARLMRNGLANRAIVGGVDSLAKFTINGFNALHILSDETCTPFDANRKGLNLGEGAAFLVLEKASELNGKHMYAEVTGYANTNDAHHPSSLSDDGAGPFLAMQEALRKASLPPDAISLINAHGTGTENNDEVESIAMSRLFERVPPFISSKSNIGHTLGAAGAIEAAYSILSIMYQECYPSLRFKSPISSTGLLPNAGYKKMKVDHVMSNSFGFGGNCSSLIFSNV